MKEVVKKEILYDIKQVIQILEVKDVKDFEELKTLSNHAIEDVALHKDLDLISVTVLIYSIYKVESCLDNEMRMNMVKELLRAEKHLIKGNLGAYNRNIQKLYRLVRDCNAKVKEHLDDVMHAARVKKGTVLLGKGLSLGQAAGLMGLSNWDLQGYASKTPVLSLKHEKVSAKKRLHKAFELFGVAS